MDVVHALTADLADSKGKKMKITKKELQKIIKEEREKLLKEMMSLGDRSLGEYANASDVSNAEDALAAVVNGISDAAFAELEDEDDAEDAAKAGLAQLMADVCQSMGYLDIYMELRKFTGA